MARNVTNQSTVTYTYAGSGVQHTASSNVNTVTVRDTAGLNIVKYTQTESWLPGDIITYSVNINNVGSYYFTGVRITDDRGGGHLTYIPGSAMLYIGGQMLAAQVASTIPLVFTLSPLPAGEMMILTYSMQVSSSIPSSVTSITNIVDGIGYTWDSTATAQSGSTVPRSTSANVSVAKTSSASSIDPGQMFSYIITLTNNGIVDANVGDVTDTLPVGYALGSVQLKIGSGPTTTLSPTDYILDPSNNFTVPSLTGPTITVPAGGQTVVTLTGHMTS